MFIDWLLEQIHGAVIFLNDSDPDQDLNERVHNLGEFDKCYKDGLLSYVPLNEPDILIVNYEDWPLSEKLMISSEGNNISADEVVNILLLRDPLNLFASRYFFWARMPKNAERWQWDDYGLWLNHAAHFQSSSTAFKARKLVSVNFNEWISDKNVRIELAARLKLDFRDTALQQISHVGSQFDPVHAKDYSNRVNARWHQVTKIPEYQSIFNDEVIHQSKCIFANDMDIASLQSSMVSSIPDARSVLNMLNLGEINRARIDAIRLCHNLPSFENWRLLAGIFAKQGSYNDVISCCLKMLDLDPGNISTRYNLARALQEQGQLDRAKFIYEETLDISGGNPGIAINLANIYIISREFERARMLLAELESSGDATFELFNTFGLLYMEEKDYLSAIEYFHKAMAINNNSIAVYTNLSRCYVMTGEGDKALDILSKLIDSGHTNEATDVTLAFVLRMSGEYGKALNVLMGDQAKAYKSLNYYTELGHVYRELDEYEKSIRAFESAMSLKHPYERTLNNIGAVYMLACKYKMAENYFRQSISINHEYADAHWNLAWTYLVMCKFEEGWREYEWRFNNAVAQKQTFEYSEEWTGQDLQGKTILLYVEQGYGDAIQFVRYCQALKEFGARVVIKCDKVLGNILASANGVDSISLSSEKNIDYYAPLLSIPGILHINSISFREPYIYPAYNEVSSDLVSMLDDNSKGKLRIGIAWCGNPDFPDNYRRSCDVEYFSALTNRDDVVLYSLQKGSAVKDINGFSAKDKIINMDSMINNFTDTAYIMSRMNLIITVDTSVAHLSAATGCRTWVLLCYSADWRWHEDEIESQWYATMKLFRQKQPGDWNDVFSRVRESLDYHFSV